MYTLPSLEGKVAIVTGASRGIGQAILLTLGRMGATVIGSATSEQGSEAISRCLQENGLQGYGVVLDVTQWESLEATIETIHQKTGAPLVLVNNAGVTRDNLLMRMREEEWDSVISANLTGVFRMTKQCLRGMLKARWGRIISLGSVVGSTGNPGQANYAATKAAIVGFSKSLASEIASRGITVNVVAPGFIDTDMTRALKEGQQSAILQNIPMGKMGQAQDIADMVAFLASDRAGYITGQTLHVNGGMFMP
jgi:3-oxoacyl-[acyl-carrier protein] reductase